MVAAYNLLADAIDCPLHLGITEAGALRTGTVKSSIGMGNLLWAGIGDTIRVSLAADPVEEIKVGFDLLKSLGLRHRGVNIIACPSCARQGFNVIKTVEALEARLAHIAQPMSLSIIGCVVNGPGEALMTDLGFTGGGKGSGHGLLWPAKPRPQDATTNQMVDHIWSSQSMVEAPRGRKPPQWPPRVLEPRSDQSKSSPPRSGEGRTLAQRSG